jgi:type IV pilus assembly protein PilV
MSLIESLIALLVLALGVMALAGVQTRLLVESRTANSRATAIGVIDDLNNRIALNRSSAIAGNYALAWGATVTAQDCVTSQCTGAQLAQSDLNLWRANVASVLPAGNASVFQSANDPRQIGISVAWAANESSVNTSKFSTADAVKYDNPFKVDAANSGVDCPANSICHIVYVQP